SSTTNLTDHEKAIFGAQWQSKALEKNLKLTEKSEEKIDEPSNDDKNERDYSLAGEIFYEDPKIRQERWLKLFKERRREVLSNET
uniref:Uncharacterized protein n=1 Tax=Panagrolaimus sp. JU765 TaxID=591449 RepID=A0AC34Q3J4_9BILA